MVSVNDPTFSDLAGMLTGMKPVSYADCAQDKFPRILNLCEKLKLKCLLPEKFLGRRGRHFQRAKKIVLLGKDLKTLKAAALAWARDGERWGCLLGYPRCCVRSYLKWKCSKIKPKPDIIKRILCNMEKRAKFDFRLNNVLNYFSRMDFNNPDDRSNYESFMDFNSELDIPSKHVISWHPCSYDCPKSIKKADVIFSFMKYHAPGYAAMLEDMLAKPVLFWDKFKYVFLDGRVADGAINYKAAAPPRSLLSEDIYKLIACCDKIKIGREQTGFYRNGNLIFSSSSPNPVLLDFSRHAGGKRSA